MANAVGGFNGTTATLEVGVLRQIQTICKGCGQEALATGRKEGAADREACHLLAEWLGLLGSRLATCVT